MNFQSFGQTVKGHSRDLDGKSKGKTKQARKVRAKPVGRNQLGVKMQLSQIANNSKIKSYLILLLNPQYFFILGKSFYSLSRIFVIEIIEDKINKIK